MFSEIIAITLHVFEPNHDYNYIWLLLKNCIWLQINTIADYDYPRSAPTIGYWYFYMVSQTHPLTYITFQ